jgi:hypothetical protein
LRVLTGVGHFTPLEAPRAVAEAVLAPPRPAAPRVAPQLPRG